MAELKRRLLNLLISFDQTLFCIVTLGHSNPDWTISARAWEWEQRKKWNGFMRPLIDWMFQMIEKDHCYQSYLKEVRR